MVRKNKKAFTLVELIVAMVVGAMLMVAIAVAFDASVKNYTANESIFKAMNTARQAVLRITTQVRSADFVALPGSEPANKLSLITPDSQNLTYDYRSGGETLYLQDFTSGSNDYLLCENVSAMTFEKDTGIVREVLVVKSVKISITITVNGHSETVVAAAVVRRNLP